MDSAQAPQPDALRIGATGDVEVFDGEAWRPVSSLLKDPSGSHREEPGPGRPDPGADGSAAESAGSVGGPPDEAEQL